MVTSMSELQAFRGILDDLKRSLFNITQDFDSLCRLYESLWNRQNQPLATGNPEIDCPLVMIPGEDGAIVTSEPHTEAFDVPVVVVPPPAPTAPTAPQIVYDGVGAASHGRIEYR